MDFILKVAYLTYVCLNQNLKQFFPFYVNYKVIYEIYNVHVYTVLTVDFYSIPSNME